MSEVALLTSILLLIVSTQVAPRRPVSPAVLFYGLWTLILAFSELSFYGIQRPSDEAYSLISLMLVFFFIGSAFQKGFRDKASVCQFALEERASLPNLRVAYLLIALSIIFNLIDVVIVARAVAEGAPWFEVRHWRMDEFATSDNPILNRRTFLEEAFRMVVLTPIELMSMPLLAYVVMLTKRRNWYNCLVGLVFANLAL